MTWSNHRVDDYFKSKFRGCILGLAVGDALGAPFEGAWPTAASQIRAKAARSENLRYTDDTHMAIGVAESLIACGSFDGRHMADIFITNFDREPWRGYGAGPPRIFQKIKAGASWDEAATDIYPGGSYGNGSAMRVAPVGLFYHHAFDLLIDAASRQSIITHTHPWGREGAVLQALAVALAVNSEFPLSPEKILAWLQEQEADDLYRQKLQEAENLLETDNAAEIASVLGNGIEAFNAVPTAICCALHHPNSYADSVVEAISLGGDTDTIACMTGAISGAALGIEDIPEDWLAKLENRDYLDSLAVQLWEAVRL
ncbi:MAG: ADP-ribosylglycohydrolase family protein [Bacillota bacterium]|nr:ADP-ribosylglycohydrolase family protein [Bacillota bacterium]